MYFKFSVCIILSQKFKSEVMVVLDNFNTKYFKIYKSFGFTNFNNFYTNPIILFQCLIILTYDLFRLKIFGFNWFIKNFNQMVFRVVI